MSNTDLTEVIKPKSDQLNADDLIAGSMTIKITNVKVMQGEQPLSISFENDNGKPYKPCKSMARVFVSAWGVDGKNYVGQSVTLYLDTSVTWAGMEVGGIRISHMSGIKKKISMPLTIRKGAKKLYSVLPLVVGENIELPEITDDEYSNWCIKMDNANTAEDLKKVGSLMADAKSKYNSESIKKLGLYYKDCLNTLKLYSNSEQDDNGVVDNEA